MQARHHLFALTPIRSGEARRVMRLSSLLMHNAAFLVFQSGWLAFCILGWLLLRLPTETAKTAGSLCIWMAMVWLVGQFVIVFVYPEWPMNRRLCHRLRTSIRDRDDRPGWAVDPDLRVVEHVPRERWNQMLLDTATDLMVIRVDSSGLHMEGDCNRYVFPRDSILGAELHSIRPSGWFTDTHMVLIYVRTAEGPIEFPISYRDHQFGSLRSSRRREQALMLVNQINGVAAGGSFGPLTDPDSIRGAWRCDGGQRSAPAAEFGTKSSGSFADESINPYRAPAVVRD